MIVKGYSGIASHLWGPYCVKSIVELITPAKYTYINEQKNSLKRHFLMTHFRMENFLFKKIKVFWFFGHDNENSWSPEEL